VKALKSKLKKRVTRVRSGEPGFTLLELATVMALILVLAAITFPAYHTAIKRSKEVVLRDDLTTMRKVIDEYTVDKQTPPQALQDLVDAGYLHAVPIDPMTGSADTWQVDVKEVPVPPDQTASGVVDVHSGSDADALDGTAYNTW
jgi:general secretion pathway protein G